MVSFYELLEPYEQRIKALEDTLSKVLSRLSALERGHSSGATEAIQFPVWEPKDGPYSYRPLDESSDETRILVVYSSVEEKDPIVCQLLHVRINQERAVLESQGATIEDEAVQQFNTLSYTWGDIDKKGSVIIEGHQFPVTKNLESALRQLRNIKTPSNAPSTLNRSFWWIDAICINQKNVLERNQQVNLMTRIYRKAAGVHIWLGAQADNSEIAIQVARQLADQTPRGPGQLGIVYPETTAEQRDFHRKALAKLFERPWWERVWVRQEVAVAKEATVHCGSEYCSFHAITLTLEILNKMDEELGFKAIQEKPTSEPHSNLLRTTSYSRAYTLALYRSRQGQGPTTAYKDLGTLIHDTRACLATDSRDKVFSILGLVDPNIWDLRADYRLSIKETFVAVTCCLISRKQSLDIISECQNPERANGFPSWVPNLVEGWKARPFPARGLHYAEVLVSEAPDFAFEGEGGCVLKARGSRIDVIETLSEETPCQDATSEELEDLDMKWRELAKSALLNPQIDSSHRGYVMRYNDDGPWIQFLSAYSDMGKPLKKTAARLEVPGDYLMAKSLLLPGDEEVVSLDVKGLKQRVHVQLMKYGVGRRLCITKMGSVLLVPADSLVGDEIWVFRGTNYPFVLREEKKGKYVVVGEAWSERYWYGRLKLDLGGSTGDCVAQYETISII